MNNLTTLLFFIAVAALYAHIFKQWGDSFWARWTSQFLMLLTIWILMHFIIKYW